VKTLKRKSVTVDAIVRRRIHLRVGQKVRDRENRRTCTILALDEDGAYIGWHEWEERGEDHHPMRVRQSRFAEYSELRPLTPRGTRWA
jgi:hypothetical protein